MSKLSVSIGIMAYNEDRNIGQLLESLLAQKLRHVTLSEIIVISSGSSDQTNAIVRSVATKDSRIKLISQKKRLGKATVVNLFIAKAKQDILVLMSADLQLKQNTLENLVTPLANAKIGIVGAHPLPVNDPHAFFGYAAHLLWRLHYHISLHQPKMGEMIAFRKIFKQIPVLSAVDEANIEPLIRGQGYQAFYQSKAVVYNKGPENLKEFLAVRRRVYAGHLAAKYEYSYEVSTFSGLTIAQCLFRNLKITPAVIFWTPAVVFLEVIGRALGYLDYCFKRKDHTIWETAVSTKKLS